MGIEISVDPMAVTRPWIFPEHQFIEWEPKDEAFCRKYGIGHEGPEQPCAYQIGNRWVVHPAIYDSLVREIGEKSRMRLFSSFGNCGLGSFKPPSPLSLFTTF